MRNDMYNTYSDQEFEYSYPISFDLRNKDYLQMNSTPNIKWHYGDTASIIFKIIDNDSEDISLTDAMITVTFTNFRGENVLQRHYVENDVDPQTMTIEVLINSEDSKRIFIRGLYYCSVEITEVDGTVTTVMPSRKCFIAVD